MRFIKEKIVALFNYIFDIFKIIKTYIFHTRMRHDHIFTPYVIICAEVTWLEDGNGFKQDCTWLIAPGLLSQNLNYSR
jgi:hypothetical protein